MSFPSDKSVANLGCLRMLSIIRNTPKLNSLTRWMNTCPKRKAMDPQQEASLSETCFLVNDEDKIIGKLSKRDCHSVQKDGTLPLHRAFSVFLFNSNCQLLLQKRSSNKITYPDHYTNSCCSHPIADVPGENEELNAIGIKRAAQRRLNYELGIPMEEIPIHKMDYITRIHYKDTGNGIWGEHEIDYVLFLKADVTVNPNPNEISEISYVPRAELDEFIPTLTGPLTPWFHLILKNRLRLWWDNIDDLDKHKNHKEIFKLQ